MMRYIYALHFKLIECHKEVTIEKCGQTIRMAVNTNAARGTSEMNDRAIV